MVAYEMPQKRKIKLIDLRFEKELRSLLREPFNLCSNEQS